VGQGWIEVHSQHERAFTQLGQDFVCGRVRRARECSASGGVRTTRSTGGGECSGFRRGAVRRGVFVPAVWLVLLVPSVAASEPLRPATHIGCAPATRPGRTLSVRPAPHTRQRVSRPWRGVSESFRVWEPPRGASTRPLRLETASPDAPCRPRGEEVTPAADGGLTQRHAGPLLGAPPDAHQQLPPRRPHAAACALTPGHKTIERVRST
jgi:hypothetical protein